jgi:translation initiation factor IF-2
MHQIIYAIADEVRDAMTGLLAPKVEERVRGQAEIRQTFPMGKRGKIAGCMMKTGYVTPKLRVRIKRGKEVLHEGYLASLKRFQDDVAQVKEGQECGIRLENFVGFADGDIMEFYELEQIKQTL